MEKVCHREKEKTRRKGRRVKSQSEGIPWNEVKFSKFQ